MIFHYCRVSTKEQNLDRQLKALNDYKTADKLFTDKVSGKNFERDGYQLMKNTAKAGDEIIVKEIDRLGRNKDEIKNELKWFKDNEITVRILDVPTTLIDFQDQDWIRDMVNNIMIEVLGAIAEREREKIHSRMMEGLAAKKARGEWDDYGRPEKNIDMDVLCVLREKQKKGLFTVEECCRQLNISRGTWYKKVKKIA